VDEKLTHETKNNTLCVSAVSADATSVNKFLLLGTRIGLMPCLRKREENIQLLEERSFLKDRQALSLPYIANGKCDFPACAINNRPPKAQFLSPSEINRCTDISKCVTVVVKTARRPQLVLRLAQSLGHTLKQNLSMIVIDDGPDSHPPDVMEKIAQFPHIRYIIGDTEDLGISLGRNMGVRLVKTKYFLSFDDDLVVTEQSNITTMLEILDITDISLVGGKFHKDFAGFMEFSNDGETGERVLKYYRSSCTVESQELTSYPGCYRCDLTANGFMARTQDILDVGGWSEELKICEHKDIFLRLKAAGKKVVYCDNFIIKNEHKTEESYNELERASYDMLRYNRVRIMHKKFNNHWNIGNVTTERNSEKWPQTWD
jgi:GT2 family glycosyltransferase